MDSLQREREIRKKKEKQRQAIKQFSDPDERKEYKAHSQNTRKHYYDVPVDGFSTLLTFQNITAP